MLTAFNTQVYFEQMFLFLPKIIFAFLILVIGFLLARFFKHLTSRLLANVNLTTMVKNTPLGEFLSSSHLMDKADRMLSNLVYWLVLLLVVYLSASVIEFTSLAILIWQIFAYIPNILTASVVLIIGVILAGLVETMVKNMARSFDSHSAILLGKMSSYMVVSLTMLIVLSELGIAREFIMIMFMGLVSAFALAFGLAVGLGGQHLVKEILGDWYQRRSQFLPAKEAKHTKDKH